MKKKSKVYWGYNEIMKKKMETTIVYWAHIGIMEKKMETTVIYWGYIGIMEKKTALLCKCGQVAAGFACSCFSAGIKDVCVDFLQSLHEPRQQLR